jgi:hypothetical protein
LRDEEAFSSSKPLVDYVLCEDCERRMRDRGEDWVLKNCLQADYTFKLRDAIAEARPVCEASGQEFYATAPMLDIDSDKLHYFALSVLWRSSVHAWKCRGRRGDVRLELGPYEEPLRLFLLDNGGFPDNSALIVRLLTMKDDRLKMIWLPETTKGAGFHSHQFAVPGLAFSFLVGGRIPPDELSLCSFRSQERFIRIARESDQVIMRDVQHRAEKARRRMR